MPRVYVIKDQKRNARLAAWVYGELKVRELTQSDLAKRRGVSQQAISLKLKKHSFDFEDFACFVEMFDPSDAEIKRLILGE